MVIITLIKLKMSFTFFLHTPMPTELYSIAAWSIRRTYQFGANWHKIKTSNHPPVLLLYIPLFHCLFFHWSNPCRPLAVSGDAYTSVWTLPRSASRAMPWVCSVRAEHKWRLRQNAHCWCRVPRQRKFHPALQRFCRTRRPAKHPIWNTTRIPACLNKLPTCQFTQSADARNLQVAKCEEDLGNFRFRLIHVRWVRLNGVNELDNKLGAKREINASLGNVELRLACSADKGALLLTKCHANQQFALCKSELRKYILRNCDAWFKFARERGLGVQNMHDLILVTECTMTADWAIATWDSATHDLEASFTVGFPGVPSLEVGFWGKWEGQVGLPVRVGPYRNASTSQGSEQDQCIFFRGLRAVKRAAFMELLLKIAVISRHQPEDVLHNGPESVEQRSAFMRSARSYRIEAIDHGKPHPVCSFFCIAWQYNNEWCALGKNHLWSTGVYNILCTQLKFFACSPKRQYIMS